MTELRRRILSDLQRYPDSSAREIGERISTNDRDVFDVLKWAERDGQVQRSIRRPGPWRWEICPDGIQALEEGT